jgi:hypothetical protein
LKCVMRLPNFQEQAMTSKHPYIATPGSRPDLAMKHLKANPNQTFSAAQLVSVTGGKTCSVANFLKAPIEAGFVLRHRRGSFRSSYQWANALQLQSVQLGTEAAEAKNLFTVALHSDGQLQIVGVKSTVSGVVLDSAQTAELREYLLHTGSFIESLKKENRHDTSQN